MKNITQEPRNKRPFIFYPDFYTENIANKLLIDVIDNARKVFRVVADAYKGKWKNNPSTNVRAVFGHWIVNAARHFLAAILLCENDDLSMVADLHHRQIFEIFIQIRYYSSLNTKEKEEMANRINAIGCIEYLTKMENLKELHNYKDAYITIETKLSKFDRNLIYEIKEDRKKRKYNWFRKSFSQLAKDVSRDNEDLSTVYQIISANVHGTWNLSIDVDNPEPGVLDFRGYPNKIQLFLRAAETLDQITSQYIKLWNEVAKSVGAEEVYYRTES